MGRPFDNKRQFERLKSYCLIRYNKISSQNDIGKTTNVKNISEGGLMFTSYEPLPVSSILRICINLPGQEKPVDTFAKVMRCIKASEKEEVYYVGISFLDIAEDDRKSICEHIEFAAHDKHGKRLIQRHHWWQFWRKKKIKTIPGTKGAFFSSGPQPRDERAS